MDWTHLSVEIDWSLSTRRRWPPARELEFSPHERRKPRNVLLYWWAGRGERRLPSGSVPIRAGDCHWSRPGWTYTCSQNPRNPLGVTAIHFDLVDRRGRVIPAGSARLPPERLRVRSPRLVEEVTRWIADRALDARAGVELSAENEEAANSLLRGLLVQLDHDTPGDGDAPAASGPAWRRLTAYIQEHLHDLEDVRQLAVKAGYTRSHFSRVFHARTGVSPREYIIRARMALAGELLRETTLTVSDIAVRAGYGDVFQFSKQFKRRTGLSPLLYRARQDRSPDE